MIYLREIILYITEKSNIKLYFSIKRKGDHYHREVVELELPLTSKADVKRWRGGEGRESEENPGGKKMGSCLITIKYVHSNFSPPSSLGILEALQSLFSW